MQRVSALQDAVAVLECQVTSAVEKQCDSAQQLLCSQADLAASKQQLEEQSYATAQQQASLLNSQQSIAALQANVSREAQSAAVSESKLQAMTDQLDRQHEQLQQTKQKLQTALYNAAAAQDAAVRLEARLSEQHSKTVDQQQQHSQAVRADSAAVQQLQANVLAMQGKISAANGAISSHRQQAQAQAAKATTAEKQLAEVEQELATKESAIVSLEAALTAASTSTDSNALLLNSLQEAAEEQEAVAAIMTKSLQRQLQQSNAHNADLSTEVEDLRSRLSVSDQGITALKENLLTLQADTGRPESTNSESVTPLSGLVVGNDTLGPVLVDSTNQHVMRSSTQTLGIKPTAGVSEVKCCKRTQPVK